jgi:uncharacterized protein YecE (DUF72 family)
MTSTPKKGNLSVGTSGFSYDHWTDGVFYPQGLPRKEWLAYYASQFDSVELNMTFYKVPEKDSFIEWQAQVPKDFRFSVKGYQYITHVKRLSGASEPLRFFMDRVTKLKENLSCMVWELPPLRPDLIKALEGFIAHLKKYPQVRHAFEIKDSLAPDEKIRDMIRKNKMSITESDEIRHEDGFTFRYIRSKGEDIPEWGRRIRKTLSEGTDCYCYLTDDTRGKAPLDAKKLLSFLET